MIKNFLTKIKNMATEVTSEKNYVYNVIVLEKDCWRMNMNQKQIFKETAKYLNKLKLSEDRHPFLIGFRQDVNELINDDNSFDDDHAHLLFNSLFNYREELNKRSFYN